ncbi:hypothetical protein Zm00014a_022381 [Zea mays]|uniref:Uncharacterized protein n=1 Tax=Zea mays TaxID=4577 RepID=A0A3L6G5T0_MAIZE|nr:hypothetical protein Zm00014a_022381 [Zea mays]
MFSVCCSTLLWCCSIVRILEFGICDVEI